MTRRFVGTAVAAILCLTTSMSFGEQRGKGGEKEKGPEPHNKAGEKKSGEKPPGENKSGNKSPGGAWSEEKPSSQKQNAGAKGEGKEAESKNKSQASGAEGAAAEHAAEKKKQPEPSGAEGAAAGAAASNRNKPAASGAEGAAAGAAASNRNKPAASGAEGVAAGAAASNRNKPAASGAEGAGVGAAAANRNNPTVSGVQGVAVGAAAANRNNPPVSGATGAAIGAAAVHQNQSANAAGRYTAVRESFNHPSLYNNQWHNDHPGAWMANNWAAGSNVWTGATLAGVGAYCGYANATPVSYGYGNNVTYQDGIVFVDGQNAGTGEVFSQQAADLAQIGQDAETTDSDQWLPLGVFALVRNEDQHAQLSLQLAINKNGIIRGNYTDMVTDHTLPIHGAVEKETQRAAWTVNNNMNFFMEAGISNLTSGEAPTLIHKYSRTEKWLLVRLAEPGSSEPVAANR